MSVWDRGGEVGTPSLGGTFRALSPQTPKPGAPGVPPPSQNLRQDRFPRCPSAAREAGSGASRSHPRLNWGQWGKVGTRALLTAGLL